MKAQSVGSLNTCSKHQHSAQHSFVVRKGNYMEELLENLYHLAETHLKFKVKKADTGNSEREIQSIIEKASSDIYDYASEILEDAEYSIDQILEEVNRQNEDELERLRNYNVLQRKRGEDYEYL